jgi:signal transduction histidine kinase
MLPFEGLATERRMALVVEAPEALPRVADPEKLQRILFNLLANAFKFTPSGGRVRCTLWAVTDGAQAGGFAVEVADSGPGVPPGTARRSSSASGRWKRGPRAASAARAWACRSSGTTSICTEE